MADTATFERQGTPRATVVRDGTVFTCVVDGIEGLEPERTPSAQEQSEGITSLNPPSVTATDAKTLASLAERAVLEAVESTSPMVPSEIVMVLMRTRMAVNGALRTLNEDV